MNTTDPDCKQLPKVVAPVIDVHKCEGAGDCADVCPYDVFEIRKLTKAELKALPVVPWVKVLVHGGKQGFVTAPDVCHACGLCVGACPEKRSASPDWNNAHERRGHQRRSGSRRSACSCHTA